MLTSINIQMSFLAVVCTVFVSSKSHIQVLNRSSKAGAALVKTIASNIFEIAKKGLKTDLNLQNFPKFSNLISGSSSTINLNFKITALYFGSQEILTAAGTPFFRSQSSCQCLSVKISEKFCACN